MAEGEAHRLTIWAVSDGRSGIENQALGLAEAVARKVMADVVVKRVGWRGRLGRLPALMNLFPKRALSDQSDTFEAPWPDLWIAAGRATLPLSIRMGRWSEGRTFVVQIQDPRLPTRMFDLVAPPKHDRLTGENVFPIIGSPHRVTTARMVKELARFRERIDPLPEPRVAVMVGGKSKAFDLSPARAETIARELDLALEQEGASLLMTFSRRTPEKSKAILRERLSHRPGFIWDGEGPNPYFALLAAADFIAVTEDSINMAAEAASTGKPVFIIEMDGDQRRKRLFHADLEARGAARPFGGSFYRWTYEPLRETDRLAEEIVRRLTDRPDLI